MKARKKLRMLVAVMAMILIASTMLTGCIKNEMRSYRPITDLNNLEQRKVGVLVGWSTDYLLTGRDDLLLYRYDEVGDLMMALCYKQLDAVALDQVTANQVLGLTEGLGQVDGQLAIEGFGMIITSGKPELKDAFNEWIAQYKETDEYAEWLERFKSFDGNNYEPINLERTGTGEKITLATYADWYPITYATSDGQAEGYEVEFMTTFANAMNYDLEIVTTSEPDMYMGTNTGMYDGLFGSSSELFAEEAKASGYNVTDNFYEMPIVVLEIKDSDKLGIKGNLDEL